VKASQIVEAVLFASDAPLKAEEIARADESLDEDRVEEAIQELRTLYDESERSFQVEELGEGYQILTRPEFATYLERFDTVPRPSRLSGPALETLAIIAYRQPIGRIEIEYIRGVGAAGVIRTLQDRSLVEVSGRGEGLGRPLLYSTTRQFLEHFGFASLDDLPRPEELPIVLRDRAPLEEVLGLDDGEDDGEPPEEDVAESGGQGTLSLGGTGVAGGAGSPDPEADDSEASEEAAADPQVESPGPAHSEAESPAATDPEAEEEEKKPSQRRPESGFRSTFPVPEWLPGGRPRN